MAKKHGKVGFIKTEETFDGSGVYVEKRTELPCRIDVVQDHPKWNQAEKVIDDFNINNKYSIIASSFAMENLGYMRYIEVDGFKWKITSAEVLRPRIVLYVGGLYNG